jgi:CRP/FNR family transcriptional regulator, cyclic AMP receptor protein
VTVCGGTRAADPTIVKELGATDLFGKVRRKSLEAIAAQARVVEHSPGKEITEEGGSATGFHLIRSGNASVDVGGSPRAKLGPGDYFGEISLIDGGPRTATVTADTPVTIEVVERRDFDSLLERVPGLPQRIMMGLAKRLREKTDRF